MSAADGYQVLLELSRGGMGRVLLARRRGAHGFERLTAIKTMRAELRERAELRSMFVDEARLMARLHHPSVAQVHDLIELEGELCLVMEYVPGVSFARLTKLRPPPAVSAEAISAVLRGLHAAHELKGDGGEPLGVVHRDVSPQNLMVDFDGRVKILDFGIAWMRRRQAPETEYGMLKGKPAYMSPEQLGSAPVDRRTDVFAAAVVLHEMLTGERLFTGESAFQVAHAMISGDIAPPSAKAGPLPDGLDEVVLAGLARDPDERFASAAAMAEALDQVVARAAGERLDAFVRRELAAEREQHDEKLRRADPGGAAGGEQPGRPTGISTAVEEPPRDRRSEIEGAPVTEPETETSSTRAVRPAAPRIRDGVLAALVVTSVLAVVLGGFFVARHLASLPVADPIAGIDDDGGSELAPAAAGTAETAEPTPIASAQSPAPVPAATSASARVVTSARAPMASPSSSARTPSSSAPASAASAAPADQATEFGFLTVGADPYALVQLDGVSIGPTPIFSRKVPVGTHQVVLVSPDTGAVRLQRTVQVAAGATAQVIAR